MTYQVIALRYRPRRFEEVVGQEETAETLRQAVLSGRLAHAYLFSGPRGVGKTSMARILAMALNCRNPAAGEPCCECETCRDITNGCDLDVIELDGASHRGIDDIREIVAGAACAPLRGRTKVYIVDEVHMLTREAFNAFLKTLEEPPSHVKFVLATTEPQRIPETVASRLQRFDFRPIGEADVVRRLEQVCGREQVVAGAGVLARIAQYARGGMRDAQTLLDQLITFAGAAPALADLDRVAGRLDRDRLESLLAALDARDQRTVWQVTREALAGVTSPEALLEQIMLELRDRVAASIARAGQVAEEELLRLDILAEAVTRLRVSPFPDVVAEVTLLRLASGEELVSIGQLLDEARGVAAGRADTPAEKREGTPVSAAASPSPPRPARATPAASAPPSAAAPAVTPAGSAERAAAPGGAGAARPGPERPAANATAEVSSAAPPRPGQPEGAKPGAESRAVDQAAIAQKICEMWPLIVSETKKKSVRTGEFLRGAVPTRTEQGVLAVEARGETTLRHLKTPATMQVLRGVVLELCGGCPEIEVRLRKQEDGGPEGGGAQPIEEEPVFKKAKEIFRSEGL